MIEKRIETFLDLKTEVIDVSSECIEESGENRGIWYFNEKFQMKNDLLIGMSPTNYHTFIVVQDREVHPRFSFNQIKFRPSREGSIRAGLFIRIKNLNDDEIKGIRDYVGTLKGKRTISCVEGVRQFLYYGAGLSVPFFW